MTEMAECVAIFKSAEPRFGVQEIIFVLENKAYKKRVLKLATYLCFHPFITKKEVALLLRVQR